MEFRRIKLRDLEPNIGQIPGVPANPRSWTRADVEALARSMEATPELVEARGGIVFPWGDRFVILGGNMRYDGAKLRRWPDLPCVILPADTPAEKLKEIILKDNSTFGRWDFEKLRADFSEFEFQDIGIQFPELPKGDKKAEDDGYDVKASLAKIKHPVTKRGDIIWLGGHILVCGDSTDFKALDLLMEGGGQQADLFLTDPPYNVDYIQKAMPDETDADGRKILNDHQSDGAFRALLKNAFSTAIQFCKDGAPAYIWMASSEIDACIESFEAAGFLYKQLLIWVKNAFTLGRQDYQWQHELCVYGWKPGAGHYFSESRRNSTVLDGRKPVEEMTKNEMRLLLKEIFDVNGIPTTTLFYDKSSRNEEHPTMKPIPMIGELIKNSSRKGDIVLDVFGGSGITLVACEQLERRCRMVELDEKYCDVIVDRWQKLTGQIATRG